MAGNASKLYGPAAAVAAALATAVASAELPPASEKLTLGPAPYLLYAAHPSMPVPPLASSSSSLHKPPAPTNTSTTTTIFNHSIDHVAWAVNSFISSSSSIESLLRPAHLCYFPNVVDSSPLLRSSTPSSSSFSPALKPRYSIPPSFAASEYVRSWHSEHKAKVTPESDKSSVKKKEVTVVLLGWLGAKQKHLKKYADWYTERGINAVTFVIPMSDMIGLKVGGKAEEQIDQLARHLFTWMNEDQEPDKEKHLFFHTFSNTGWLTYGVLLERLLQHDNKLLEKVKGCVVDSAPVAEPDPQVWASGFSAAFLKKKSVAARKVEVSDILNYTEEEMLESQLRPDVTEQALMNMLEKFFSVFLQLPYVKKRLSEVVNILSKDQPKCPQLYFYSTADKVIPAKSVESFMEEQRKAGRTVKACNLKWSPHVDHFRSFPEIYSLQLNDFIHECLSQLSPRNCG